MCVYEYSMYMGVYVKKLISDISLADNCSETW